ncbi:hypothetical protein AKO1_013641 [Acrasis kona]|uniref:glucan endo-1,3-beta-D-glucosidase n=1 Tax=Acrasis kona TaxID=1008807 RepID=A0AAW2YLQ5_9EUKA
MTPSTTSTGSISFADQVAPYSPWNAPPTSLTKQLLQNLIKNSKFNNIMIYYIEPNVVSYAQELGITVLGIIGLTMNTDDNKKSIESAISVSRQYPNTMLGLICGNEMGNDYGATSNVAYIINNCIATLRAANIPQAIGVNDIFNTWYNQGAGWKVVSNNVDFVGLNDYAWYQNYFATLPMTCQTPANAARTTLANHNMVQAIYPDKPVIQTEFGWPGAPAGSSIAAQPNIYSGQVCSSANNANQATVVQGVIDLFRSANIPCNIFAAYRESWKVIGTSAIEGQWGICQEASPYTCINVPK